MFKLGLDVKAASSFGVAPSFKEARDFRAEGRENEMKCGAPPTWINLPCVNLSA